MNTKKFATIYALLAAILLMVGINATKSANVSLLGMTQLKNAFKICTNAKL